MRELLAPLDGQRITVRATVAKHSACIGWAGVREPTILFRDVALLDGTVLTDHLWMPLGKRFAALDTHLGDVVEFSGRVAQYRRGLKRLPGEPATFTIDYGLANPTRCTVAARLADLPAPEPEPLPVALPDAANGVAMCTPVDPPLPPFARLLQGIEALSAEIGEAPSLKRLYARAAMSPMAFLGHLQKQARAGRIAFQPDGRVVLTAGTAGSR